MFCEKCGEENNKNVNFCNNCGNQLSNIKNMHTKATDRYKIGRPKPDQEYYDSHGEKIDILYDYNEAYDIEDEEYPEIYDSSDGVPEGLESVTLEDADSEYP